MDNKTDKSYLLSCAPEIRNVIYGYVLSYDNPIVRGKPQAANSITLALLQVSKSVEQEAAPKFYEQNLFRFNLPYLHEHNQKQAKEGPSSYDDAQRICSIIEVPMRHINSLRSVSLINHLPGCWPNGPLNDRTLGPQGLGIVDLENIIKFLVARNAILNSLSITLKRTNPCGLIQWDPDPCRLLRELDLERRISTAVGSFANLGRLEIRKSRLIHKWPKQLKVPSKWTAVPPEALNQVKIDHFANAKAVLYTHRAARENRLRPETNYYCIAEEFLIDFQRMEVKERKLEYLSELEREGLDGGTGTSKE